MVNLSGLVLINDVDIYDEYGAFLSVEKEGDMTNLESIFTPSSVKSHVAIDFREVPGEKYPEKLTVVNEARDLELIFCIKASTKSTWLEKYTGFISFLKNGDATIDDETTEGHGWLNVVFPTLNDHEITVFYKSCSKYSPLTYLWKEGVQASYFKVLFREPKPIF